MKRILDKIKDTRKKRGYSHDNMATELQISQAAYTKIEKGETKLTVERLYEIATILNVSIVDILDVNPNTIFNQDNKDNAIGQVVNQSKESKDAYEKLISSLKEEISFLREMLKKNK